MKVVKQQQAAGLLPDHHGISSVHPVPPPPPQFGPSAPSPPHPHHDRRFHASKLNDRWQKPDQQRPLSRVHAHLKRAHCPLAHPWASANVMCGECVCVCK